jgi:parallel beta-helix repeat protein/predicted outer membrane repeat protein
MKNVNKPSMFVMATLFVLCVTFSAANAQTRIFVAADGSGDGSSWAAATADIQSAINNAIGETEIWIKAGVYYVPGDTIFTLKDGVSLYGGFSGMETNILQRSDFRPGGANETKLSGDLDKNGVTDAGNARRIMYGEDITSATVLSGLTIEGGYASVSGDDGGGIRLNGGNMVIEDCAILSNYCDDNGAGLYLYNDATITVSNCIFAGNTAADKGGAAYTATGCDAQFINCIFENNTGTTDAGAVRVYISSPVFFNCTFVNNTLNAGDGAAIDVNSTGANPTIVNCVFWGNQVGGVTEMDIALSSSSALATITNCAIEGAYTAQGATASGIIDISGTAPGFAVASATPGAAGYDPAADWSILSGSPLINAGIAAGAPAMDFTNGYRDATPDIGAYEFNAEQPFVIATDISGFGTVIPNGAYVKPGADQVLLLTPDAGFEISVATYNGADILALLTDNGDGSFSYTASAVAADGLLKIDFTPLPVEYTLSVTAGANGTIDPSGEIKVTVTDTTRFTITPGTGFTLADLLLNSESVMDFVVDNNDGTFSYEVSNIGMNSTLEVSFIAVYTVTVTSGDNGSISDEGTFTMTGADERTLTITPAGGYTLDAFTVDGSDASGDLVDNGNGTWSYTLTGLTSNTTVNATFKEFVANVLYVSESGTGDGSSWENAMGNLQDAIFASGFGDEIWVAKGIYIVPGIDSSFTLANGVSLYGGFAGTESSKGNRRNYRMGEPNETKLTADIDGNGFLTGGNGSRVIFGEFINAATTIDGFTINGGFSDQVDSNGAGMKLRASSPNIINCTFYDNYCDDGAAMYLYRSGDEVSSPMISGCIFIKNFANDDGGAIYAASGTRAKFINCLFANNFANDEGGAIRNYECAPFFINCTFVYNALPDTDPGGGGTYGPAMRNYQTSSPYMNCEPTLINTVFWRNQDGSTVGSYDVSNTAAMSTAGANATIINCALDSISSSCIVTDTLNISGYNQNDINPGFADVSGTPGYQGYNPASDWNLVETSILIGQGTASGDDVPETDIRGFERGAAVDIGAYEYGEYIGIKSSAAVPFIDAYPNPNRGIFMIRSQEEEIAGASVFNLTGAMILSIKDTGTHLLPVDLSGEPGGIYLIRVTGETGRMNTIRIVIE